MIKTSLSVAQIEHALKIAGEIVAFASQSPDPQAIFAVINYHLALQSETIWTSAKETIPDTMDAAISLLIDSAGAYMYFVSPVGSTPAPIPDDEELSIDQKQAVVA